MDPISTLALVCNILDLIERGVKCSSIIKDVYLSRDGLRKRHQTVLRECDTLSTVSDELSKARSQARQSPVTDEMRATAAHCQSISTAIQAVVDDCRPKKEKSLLSAAGASIRILLQQSNLEELQARLESGQRMIHSLVATKTLMDIEQLGRQFDIANRRMETQVQQSREHMSSILKNVSNLNISLTNAGASRVILKHLKEVLEAATEASDTVKVTQILDNLRFPAMNDRFRTVVESAEDTFDWIFEAPEVLLQKQAGLKISFSDWLTSGSGIFHIEGKPGAGKSTLMKYLCEHDDTLELLNEWAGGDTLIFSNFFFWKQGSAEERSLGGLIRGLLSSVIQQNFQFARLLFPKHWSSASSGFSRSIVSDKEVGVAFNALIESHEVLGTYRICFFIDGLDEFDESTGCSHFGLTNKLLKWASSSSQKVKLCVSSRQLPVFDAAFSSCQKLTLQLFTTGDIHKLVNQRLKTNKMFRKLSETEKDGCDRIIGQILVNAEGVFLWVSILLNKLENALVNRCSVPMLEKIVQSAPKELEDFFAYILDSIPSDYRMHAFTLFAMAMRLEGILLFNKVTHSNLGIYAELMKANPWNLTLLSCSYLLEGLDWLPLAKVTERTPATLPTDLKSYQKRIEIAKVQVASYCSGLLESRGDIVRFTHRSIPEFLDKFLVQRCPTSELNDELITAALSWVVLIDISYIKDPAHSVHMDRDVDLGKASGSFLDAPTPESGIVSHWTDKDVSIGTPVEKLLHLAMCVRQTVLDNPGPIMLLLQKIEEVLLRRRFGVSTMAEVPRGHQHYGFYKFFSHKNLGMISLACLVGLHELLVWDHQNETLSLTKGADWFLANTLTLGLNICHDALPNSRDQCEILGGFDYKIYEYIFQAGMSVATKRVPPPAWVLGSESGSEQISESLTESDSKLTLWEEFWIALCTGGLRTGNPPGFLWLGFLPASHWKNCEVWLRYGANTQISIALHEEPETGDPMPENEGRKSGGTNDRTAISSEIERCHISTGWTSTASPGSTPEYKLSTVMRRENGDGFFFLKRVAGGDNAVRQSFRQLLKTSGGSISLEEYLVFRNPPNLDTLLQLIEKNKKAKTSCAEEDNHMPRQLRFFATAATMSKYNVAASRVSLFTGHSCHI